jgi:hypothetical protein
MGTGPSIKCTCIEAEFGDFTSWGFGWTSLWMKRQKHGSAFIVLGCNPASGGIQHPVWKQSIN